MRISWSFVLLLAGCSSAQETQVAQARDAGGVDAGGGGDAGRETDGGGALFDASSSDTGGDPLCTPPDMLIALDRTGTMSRTVTGQTPTDAPAYASAKFSIAIRGIQALVTPPLDQTIRFGLELWPREAPGCVTLAERVTGTAPTNAACDAAEVVVSPEVSTGATIAASIDPATTPICTSTPTGRALIDAATHLATIREPGREQYVLLVTDGADWDQTCPTPDPLVVTQDNARSGIKTFVVGFSGDGALAPGGVGVSFLNDMACAGMTATDFAVNCRQTPDGAYVAVDPSGGPRLFQQADDAVSLQAAMAAVTQQVCCSCPK